MLFLKLRKNTKVERFRGSMTSVNAQVGAFVACLMLVLTLPLAVAHSDGAIQGRASVIDGDTIEIHGSRIRFNGIDAPESDQRCHEKGGKLYRCGAASAKALDRLLRSSSPTVCQFVTLDQYDRFVGDCYLNNGESVQEWMVSNGHALDWPRYSRGKYASHQEYARKYKLGVWQGAFDAPWDWRRGKRSSTKATLRPAPGQVQGSGECSIKGNINSKGRRIFHVPGQRDYAKTKISENKGERWFCSREEAIAAGWRPARR